MVGTLVSNTQRKRLLKAKQSTSEATRSTPLTAFRESEKKYLARDPVPDYTDVLDLAAAAAAETVPYGDLVERHALVHDVADVEKDFTEDASVFTLKRHPGIIIIPNLLTPSAQRRLIKNCLRRTTKRPNLNNLDTHYDLPQDGLWYHYEQHHTNKDGRPPLEVKTLVDSGLAATQKFEKLENSRKLITNDAISSNSSIEVLSAPKDAPPPSASLKSDTAPNLMLKMRWTNLGLMYHWTSKSYHFEEVFEKGLDAMIKVPSDLAQLSKTLLRAIPKSLVPVNQDWSTFLPESGIVNFYQLRNTLMGHIDQSELVEDQPLVSLSFGHSAVFLIGGVTRDEKPTAIYLRSGDALIMSGACRRVYHGVPRIIEGSLPDYLDRIEYWKDVDPDTKEQEREDHWDVFAKYLSTTRINVNIRQVFPEGYFDGQTKRDASD